MAWAQYYPARPVHIIVGFPPGAQADIIPRLMAQWLSEQPGQSFVVENRPGDAGNLAAETVAHAVPDGYTLLSVSPTNAFNASVYKSLSFDFIRDIAPVAGIARGTYVMVVNPSLPAATVPEFITYAKAHPGQIKMASSGTGTAVHMNGELFKMMTGVSMLHVPYSGAAPAIADLLSGRVQVMFATMPSSIKYVRSGKLRALAVTAAIRSDALPEIPTVAEFVPGYEASLWNGLGAPKNTPTEIIDKLNTEINAGLTDSKTKMHLANLGGVPLPLTPAEFGKLIADETDKWGKVVKLGGIGAD